MLGLHVHRIYQERGSVVLTGVLNGRSETVSVFWRDHEQHGANWVQQKMTEHAADRYFTNDAALLSFDGIEDFESIEEVFVDQMSGGR